MASSRNPPASGRASFASDSTRTATATTPQPGPQRPAAHSVADSQYSISAVLAEPHTPGSLLPSLPTLPSASSYLPSQLSSLSTTFTSAGTLPKAASGAKSVAQRRSQAPPIHVTDLRKVARTEFDAYLADVSGDFERWQRESRLARDADGRDAVHARGALQGDDGDGDDDRSVGLGVRAAGPAGSPALPPPVSSEVLPALDDVPQIFFDSSFDLANPRTFDLVTERIQLSPHPSPRLSLPSTAAASSSSSTAFDSIPGLGPHTLNDLAADQVLQDKLSHYTAVIESHLVREIGLRSSSFFAALSNLQGLHSEGEAALAKITELKAALKASEGGVGATAQHGLQVLRAQARRRGLERIDEAVRAVEEVWVAVEGVKELVENGEWDGALEVSEQVEDAYYGSAAPPSGDPPAPASPRLPSSSTTSPATSRGSPSRTPTRPLNLTKLRALSSLPTKLALLRAQIAKSLEGELTSVLEHEMDVGIDEHVRLARDGRRWKGKGKALEPPSAAAAAAAANGGGLGAPRALHAVSEETSSAASGGDDDVDVGLSPERVARERTLERVRPVVSALVRAGGMDSAVLSWRESVLREVRALVREHLPTSETPTAEDEDHFAQVAVRSVSRGTSVDLGTISEKSVSLAKKLRALPHPAFLALARDTYAGLLACIEVVDLQARVLLELWSASRHEEQRRKARRRGGAAAAGQNGLARAGDDDVSPVAAHAPGATLAVPGSAAELAVGAVPASTDSSRSSATDDASSLGTDITDVVHAVAELANVRFSKVIGVRTEVHAHLALADFVEIFDLSWAFVVACERVCQRMIVGLRGAMVSQAKTFLQTFHQRQITENARVVEEEQWAAAEVPPETQANIQLILDSATSDPPALLLGERRTAQLAAESSTANGGSTDAEPAKQIDIEGRQFFAVSAGLVTVAVLVEYLKVLANVPMLTTDAMSKIIEFMKVFNSRTCQVVLGAGAMRSAGLKNITAKHLALASQALSIMIALIPYIREAVRRHLNPKQAVMLTEFDKLKRDYQEHQHEIHAKLVAIMSDRLQVHSRSLEGINFEEPAPRGPDTPNAYMEALVKEHNTLHKVLSRFLATETVAAIMGQVFSALDERLVEVFARVEPRSRSARDRMLVDVRYLRERLGELKGVEDNGPGKALEALVSAKPVPEAPAPPPAPAPAPVLAPSKPAALPPRTSSIPPRPDSPATASTLVAPASAPLPAPEPPTAPMFSNAHASTSSTSLSSTTTATPQPPSPVPVPAALPPSPKPASPAPYVSQKKKKSLAERLAESMGRKAAHTEPEPTGAPAEAASSASLSTSAPAQDAPRSSSEARRAEPHARPAPAGELTPLALERAFEDGTGVDTPSLERALQLEGIELAAGGLATPAREELDEIEKAVEREMERADGAVEDEVRALEMVAQEDERAVRGEDALGTAGDIGAQVGRDDPVDSQGELVQPVEAAEAAAGPAVDGEGDVEPAEVHAVQAVEPAPAADVEPAPAADDEAAAHVEVDVTADNLDEPVAVVEPVIVIEPAVVEEPVTAGEPVADLLLSSTADAPLLDDQAPIPSSADPRPLEGPVADEPDIEPAPPALDAEPVENGDAAAAEALVDAAPPSAAVDETSLVDNVAREDVAGEDGVESATDTVLESADATMPSSAPVIQLPPTAEASAPQHPAVSAAATPSADVAPPLEPASTSEPAPLAPSTSAAGVAVEPAPAPPPVASPAPASSSTSSPAPAVIDPTAPPRRKTLKERLAEAARRGSSGGSGSSLTSPPTSPSRVVEPASSPVAMLQSAGHSVGEDKGVVTSPTQVASALPETEVEQPVAASGQQPSEEKLEVEVEDKVESDKPNGDAAGSIEVDEEESTFL